MKGDNITDPAFPIASVDGVWHCGLSRREYFAAMALQGLATQYSIDAIPPDKMSGFAVKLADALIAELDK